MVSDLLFCSCDFGIRRWVNERACYEPAAVPRANWTLEGKIGVWTIDERVVRWRAGLLATLLV